MSSVSVRRWLQLCSLLSRPARPGSPARCLHYDSSSEDARLLLSRSKFGPLLQAGSQEEEREAGRTSRDAPEETRITSLRRNAHDEPTKSSQTFPLFSEALTPEGKVDLSYVHPFSGLGVPTPRTKEHKPLFRALKLKATQLPFRRNRGLRQLVGKWADHAVSHPSGLGTSLEAHIKCYHASRDTFDHTDQALLAKSGFEAEDVVKWSWIFMAVSSAQMVSRYLQIQAIARTGRRPSTPLFVVLQILRLDVIRSEDFRKLMQDFGRTSDAPAGFVDLAPGNESRTLNTQEATLLLLRLLRHGRKSTPDKILDIATIACDVLFQQALLVGDALSNSCNTLLKLIGLPMDQYPMRFLHYQKDAQVYLLRRMITSRPEVPLNRQGYRALILVQLAHRKSAAETDWARAKSLSWPPWREDKSGMEQRLTYPGKESRAGRLLRRMQEAGYAPHAWEMAAQIYAGWDTDSSPTIQTRKHMPYHFWAHQDEHNEQPPSATDALIWSARVEATRSIREAWAVFLAYRKAVKTAGGEPQHSVYQAMFEKLIAQTEELGPAVSTFPGDGRETWPDPRNPQDVIYVASEPPQPEDLYQEMLDDGIKPHGDLLALLVRNADTVEHAIGYIRRSDVRLSDKQILLRGVVGIADNANTLATTGLTNNGRRLVSAVIERAYSISTTYAPSRWGPRLLTESRSMHAHPYNAALIGLLRRVSEAAMEGFSKQRGSFAYMVRHEINFVLTRLQRYGAVEDEETFRVVNELLHLMLTARTLNAWSREIMPLSWVKRVFASCVYDSTSKALQWITPQQVHDRQIHRPPTPYQIRLLIETLGIFRDTQGILELLSWLDEHHEVLHYEHRHFRQGQREMKVVHTVARIFVEGLLDSTNTSGVLYKNLSEKDSRRLRLPTRTECFDFIREREGWTRRHLKYLQLNHSVDVHDTDKDQNHGGDPHR